MPDQTTETAEAKYVRETWDVLSTRFDNDGSGGVTLGEINQNAAAILTLDPTQASILLATFDEIALMRREQGLDQNAPITRADIEAVSTRVVVSPADAERVGQSLDADERSGTITHDDALKGHEDIRQAFQKIDTDNNRSMTFGELMENNGGSLSITVGTPQQPASKLPPTPVPPCC